MKNLLTLCAILMSAYGISQTKIMTFNIRYNNPDDGVNSWSKRKADVCKLINYYRPDFIGLQEVLPDQVTFINNTLKDYNYFGFGRDGVGTNSESVPVFYNTKTYKLLDKQVFWLSKTPDRISKGWDAALNRIVTYVVLKHKTTQETFYVFNAHFDHRGKVARNHASQLILDKIKELHLEDKMVIVLGDLNAKPNTTPITTLKTILDDTFENSAIPSYGPIGTFNGFKPDRIPESRIDYIFTRNLDVLSYRSIDDKRPNGLCVSDHLPILVNVAK